MEFETGLDAISTEAPFLRDNVGRVITDCLVDVVQVRPDDPIEFMAMWLYHHVNTRMYFQTKENLARAMNIFSEDERAATHDRWKRMIHNKTLISKYEARLKAGTRARARGVRGARSIFSMPSSTMGFTFHRSDSDLFYADLVSEKRRSTKISSPDSADLEGAPEETGGRRESKFEHRESRRYSSTARDSVSSRPGTRFSAASQGARRSTIRDLIMPAKFSPTPQETTSATSDSDTFDLSGATTSAEDATDVGLELRQKKMRGTTHNWKGLKSQLLQGIRVAQTFRGDKRRPSARATAFAVQRAQAEEERRKAAEAAAAAAQAAARARDSIVSRHSVVASSSSSTSSSSSALSGLTERSERSGASDSRPGSSEKSRVGSMPRQSQEKRSSRRSSARRPSSSDAGRERGSDGVMSAGADRKRSAESERRSSRSNRSSRSSMDRRDRVSSERLVGGRLSQVGKPGDLPSSKWWEKRGEYGGMDRVQKIASRMDDSQGPRESHDIREIRMSDMYSMEDFAASSASASSDAGESEDRDTKKGRGKKDAVKKPWRDIDPHKKARGREMGMRVVVSAATSATAVAKKRKKHKDMHHRGSRDISQRHSMQSSPEPVYTTDSHEEVILKSDDFQDDEKFLEGLGSQLVPGVTPSITVAPDKDSQRRPSAKVMDLRAKDGEKRKSLSAGPKPEKGRTYEGGIPSYTKFVPPSDHSLDQTEVASSSSGSSSPERKRATKKKAKKAPPPRKQLKPAATPGRSRSGSATYSETEIAASPPSSDESEVSEILDKQDELQVDRSEEDIRGAEPQKKSSKRVVRQGSFRSSFRASFRAEQARSTEHVQDQDSSERLREKHPHARKKKHHRARGRHADGDSSGSEDDVSIHPDMVSDDGSPREGPQQPHKDWTKGVQKDAKKVGESSKQLSVTKVRSRASSAASIEPGSPKKKASKTKREAREEDDEVGDLKSYKVELSSEEEEEEEEYDETASVITSARTSEPVVSEAAVEDARKRSAKSRDSRDIREVKSRQRPQVKAKTSVSGPSKQKKAPLRYPADEKRAQSRRASKELESEPEERETTPSPPQDMDGPPEGHRARMVRRMSEGKESKRVPSLEHEDTEPSDKDADQPREFVTRKPRSREVVEAEGEDLGRAGEEDKRYEPEGEPRHKDRRRGPREGRDGEDEGQGHPRRRRKDKHVEPEVQDEDTDQVPTASREQERRSEAEAEDLPHTQAQPPSKRERRKRREESEDDEMPQVSSKRRGMTRQQEDGTARRRRKGKEVAGEEADRLREEARKYDTEGEDFDQRRASVGDEDLTETGRQEKRAAADEAGHDLGKTPSKTRRRRKHAEPEGEHEDLTRTGRHEERASFVEEGHDVEKTPSRTRRRRKHAEPEGEAEDFTGRPEQPSIELEGDEEEVERSGKQPAAAEIVVPGEGIERVPSSRRRRKGKRDELEGEDIDQAPLRRRHKSRRPEPEGEDVEHAPTRRQRKGKHAEPEGEDVEHAPTRRQRKGKHAEPEGEDVEHVTPKRSDEARKYESEGEDLDQTPPRRRAHGKSSEDGGEDLDQSPSRRRLHVKSSDDGDYKSDDNLSIDSRDRELFPATASESVRRLSKHKRIRKSNIEIGLKKAKSKQKFHEPLPVEMAVWALEERRLVCAHPILGTLGELHRVRAEQSVDNWVEGGYSCRVLYELEIYTNCDADFPPPSRTRSEIGELSQGRWASRGSDPVRQIENPEPRDQRDRKTSRARLRERAAK